MTIDPDMKRDNSSFDLEVGQPLLEDSSTDSPPTRPYTACTCQSGTKRPFYKRSVFWLSYLNVLILITSLSLFFRRPSAGLLNPNAVLKASAAYTPLYDLVDMTPVFQRVDGRLHNTANSYIYRGDPGPETDAAWDDLAAEDYEVIVVGSDTLERAGFIAEHYYKVPETWNYGDDAFPVQIDAFHQVHCLNFIRKQMHYDHYYAAEFGPEGPDSIHWMHLKHCLHMILQSITCNANADIIPHRWVEKDEVPVAQWGIERKCKNFEALSAWNKQHAIQHVRGVWGKPGRPKDAYVWPDFGEP